FPEREDIEDFDRPERWYESLFAGLEPVEHVERHGRLFVGKAPGQGYRRVDNDPRHGRASWRNSRRLMPPSESPCCLPKIFSRSHASTTSGDAAVGSK